MTQAEIARKYTPKLLRGEINQKTFDYVVSLGKESAGEKTSNGDGSPPNVDPGGSGATGTAHDACGAVQTILDAFGGHETSHTPITPSGGIASQKSRLLVFLADGEWKTTVQILQSVYGTQDREGIARIAARVYDLRQEGHKIESEKITSGVWRYRKSPEPVSTAGSHFSEDPTRRTVKSVSSRAENTSRIPIITTA